MTLEKAEHIAKACVTSIQSSLKEQGKPMIKKKKKKQCSGGDGDDDPQHTVQDNNLSADNESCNVDGITGQRTDHPSVKKGIGEVLQEVVFDVTDKVVFDVTDKELEVMEETINIASDVQNMDIEDLINLDFDEFQDE